MGAREGECVGDAAVASLWAIWCVPVGMMHGGVFVAWVEGCRLWREFRRANFGTGSDRRVECRISVCEKRPKKAENRRCGKATPIP